MELCRPHIRETLAEVMFINAVAAKIQTRGRVSIHYEPRRFEKTPPQHVIVKRSKTFGKSSAINIRCESK